jgi:putative ABC transport system permease protein
VGGDFFAAVGLPIHAGRPVGNEDGAGSPPVMVINEAFAQLYFPGGDALGQRVNGAEVVGVAADSRMGALRDLPSPTMFVPAFQQQQGSFCFQVRTAAPLAAFEPLLRQAVREVAPSAAVYDVTTPRMVVAASVSRERLLAALTSFFGALTLLLASLGLYGLMAYSIRRQTREIGVRMALGARPADVLRMTLGRGLGLVGAGTAVGLAGALALTRLTTAILYGVAPYDPLTIAGAVFLLLSVTVFACWVPAFHAARIDPAVALRCE